MQSPPQDKVSTMKLWASASPYLRASAKIQFFVPKAPRLRERPGGILSPLPAIFVPTDLGRPNPIPWNNIETEIESPTPRSGLAAYKMSSRSP